MDGFSTKQARVQKLQLLPDPWSSFSQPSVIIDTVSRQRSIFAMSSFRESIMHVTATIDCLHREIVPSVLDFSNGFNLFHTHYVQSLRYPNQ